MSLHITLISIFGTTEGSAMMKQRLKWVMKSISARIPEIPTKNGLPSIFDLLLKSSKSSNKTINTKAEHTHLYLKWFICYSICTTFLTHPQRTAQTNLYNQESISVTIQPKYHLYKLVSMHWCIPWFRFVQCACSCTYRWISPISVSFL